MQLPRSKQGLAVIGLPRIEMKLPTGDGHSNIQGTSIMIAHHLRNGI